MEKKQWSKQNDNFASNTHRFYTTLCHTYWLLQCKEHIKITSNHSKINIEKNREKQNDNFAFNTHRIYTTLYHTYILLQCKEHI